MAAAEFCATLAALDLAQCRVARWFSINVRSVRRWQRGDRRIPAGVSIIFGLLAARTITADQIEQAAAVLIPARTNGDTKPTPPAPSSRYQNSLHRYLPSPTQAQPPLPRKSAG